MAGRRAKPWYESKTVWANLVLLALAVVDLLSVHLLNVPAGTWGLVAGVLNLVLRFLTDQPLSVRKGRRRED